MNRSDDIRENGNVCNLRVVSGIALWCLATTILLAYYTHEKFANIIYSSDSLILRNTSFSNNYYTTSPRVMCMIFITVGKWKTRGESVRRTWSRHCYRRRFFFSRNTKASIPDGMQNISHELAALNVPEGRAYLTQKTMTALEYSVRKFHNDADWYLKADDDVYVVYRNLLRYLSKFNPDKPYYLGCIIRTHLQHGYNSGGGGYLLSRNAASMVVNEGRRHYPELCAGKKAGGFEDVDMGHCLHKLGIYPFDTRDTEKQSRFDKDNPLRLLKGVLKEGKNRVENYHSAKYQGMIFSNYENKKKDRMMSPEAITFHYVSPAQMYMYDFLLSLSNSTGV